MEEFPQFMRNPLNAVASHQKSDGVEGYLYDGEDGSQAIIFQCATNGIAKEHVHDYDEYFVVVQGEYTLGIEGRTVRLTAGQEYYLPRGIPHDGAFLAGTRTINVFGGRRAERRPAEDSTVNLEGIWRQIDSIDSEIIRRLSKRAELVSAAGKLKKDEEGVRDTKRVEQVIEKVKAKASAEGLDPELAEEIFRTIIRCFVRKELAEYDHNLTAKRQGDGDGRARDQNNAKADL